MIYIFFQCNCLYAWMVITRLVAKGFLNSICDAPGVDCYDLMTAFTGIINEFHINRSVDPNVSVYPHSAVDKKTLISFRD